MIDQVDQRLKDWVGTVLKNADVSMTLAGNPQAQNRVSLYLMDLCSRPPPRNLKRAPLQVALRYLVTTWTQQPEEGHRMLGQLVFAAMENPEFEVELSPLDASIWAAFGIAPRPFFMLRVLLQQERPEPATHLVRAPLVLQASPVTSLYGLVLGPGDIPIMGARVELPALHLAIYTDTRGRFYFPSIPGASTPTQVHISAKGHSLSATADKPTSDSDPLVIRFTFTEE